MHRDGTQHQHMYEYEYEYRGTHEVLEQSDDEAQLASECCRIAEAVAR